MQNLSKTPFFFAHSLIVVTVRDMYTHVNKVPSSWTSPSPFRVKGSQGWAQHQILKKYSQNPRFKTGETLICRGIRWEMNASICYVNPAGAVFTLTSNVNKRCVPLMSWHAPISNPNRSVFDGQLRNNRVLVRGKLLLVQKLEFLDSNQSGRRHGCESKHVPEREIRDGVMGFTQTQCVCTHGGGGNKMCVLVVVSLRRIFCAGLLSGWVPAGPVLPGGRHLWRSSLQEARGHLGTLHQRVCLLPGSAHGSQRGNCAHNASECTNKPPDQTQACCFSCCHRCLCDVPLGFPLISAVD